LAPESADVRAPDDPPSRTILWRYPIRTKATLSEAQFSFLSTSNASKKRERIFKGTMNDVKSQLLFCTAEFRDGSYLERLFLLQEAIVQRFGFINCMLEAPNNPDATSREHQYVPLHWNSVYFGIKAGLETQKSGAVSRKQESTNWEVFCAR
jgi:hypothetical protein